MLAFAFLKYLLPLIANLMRSGVRFGAVKMLLFSVPLAGEEVVPEDLQCKELPASVSYLCFLHLSCSFLIITPPVFGRAALT